MRVAAVRSINASGVADVSDCCVTVAVARVQWCCLLQAQLQLLTTHI
jgi:hypothetical protein